MARFSIVNPENSTGKARDLLDAVQKKLGLVPNMVRVMANSPAVLEAYLSFSGALAAGSLNAKLREQIALEVGEQNSCQYCVSAHTAIGKMTGLSESEIESAREARSSAPKHAAALAFARQIVAKQGRTTQSDMDAVRGAGFTDSEIAEIIAHVALNIFTNYFNNTADVEVDFPKIALRKSA